VDRIYVALENAMQADLQREAESNDLSSAGSTSLDPLCVPKEVTRIWKVHPMTTTTAGRPDPRRLILMSWSFAAPLLVEAGVRTGLFDLLEREPRTIGEGGDRTLVASK